MSNEIGFFISLLSFQFNVREQMEEGCTELCGMIVCYLVCHINRIINEFGFAGGWKRIAVIEHTGFYVYIFLGLGFCVTQRQRWRSGKCVLFMCVVRTYTYSWRNLPLDACRMLLICVLYLYCLCILGVYMYIIVYILKVFGVVWWTFFLCYRYLVLNRPL